MSDRPYRVAYGYQSGGYHSGSPRQRAVSATLSAIIILLVLLAAIYQTQVAPRLEKKEQTVTTFDVQGDKHDKGDKKAEAAKPAQEKKAQQKKPQKFVQPVETPPKDTPKAPSDKPAFTFLKMSSSDMAAADIGKMSSSAPSGEEAGGGKVYGPGEGPGGAVLYKADWYRRPTDAELATYLPPQHPDTGYGLIACQTIPDYRVENCQILGESPRGSGFGLAVLNAAWQFRVKPPSKNGKPMIGEWVSIRIDYGMRRLSAN
ncbi:hypothetical protein MTR62_07340 [Novosphingobium sp. 1949]|uniref:Energy transducer TonB n=1 Tax=Novosphingobium organovorum TaxID=2930092 RepID=A0ABT0BCF3_9SPHN|nr:hypothetical protein [Novosphingobium organovorum]MCJ2182504.1 hypothetical protein [Novosphingobium organovorum]